MAEEAAKEKGSLAQARRDDPKPSEDSPPPYYGDAAEDAAEEAVQETPYYGDGGEDMAESAEEMAEEAAKEKGSLAQAGRHSRKPSEKGEDKKTTKAPSSDRR